jgi:VanZ family protein
VGCISTVSNLSTTKPKVFRWFWLWGPAIGQMAVIFVLSGIPNLKELPGGISDVTGHFAGYMILGTLVVRAAAGARWAGVSARAAARAWLISAAYGVSDEFHQSFVPGRSPSGVDWIADATGAAAAVVAIAVVASFVRRRRKGREV